MPKNFWINKWYGQVCGISHTRLRPGGNKSGQSYCIFLSCKHGFYRSVLNKWIENCPTDPTCPMCRLKIEFNNYKS